MTIADAEAVAATARGVLIDDGSNSWTTVAFDDANPRGLALLIDGTIVYQPAESNDIGTPTDGFAIIDDDGAELYGEQGRAVTLYDVGHIDGNAVILAGSSTAMPASFEDAEGELILIDIATGERTPLRDIGGFESGVRQARFGDGAISVLAFTNAQNVLEILENDGTPRHEIELPSDTDFSLLDFDEAVWVLEPRFVGDEFEPVLGTRQYDLETAASREADLALVEEGVDIGTGYCGVADFLDDRIVCDRSQAGPISIAVDVSDPVTTAVPNIDFGTVRFRASQ